jgi:hypothetical protein
MNKPSHKEKEILYCEVCGWDDKKVKAKYEGLDCGSCACQKHYDQGSGDCPNCPPPQMMPIARLKLKK